MAAQEMAGHRGEQRTGFSDESKASCSVAVADVEGRTWRGRKCSPWRKKGEGKERSEALVPIARRRTFNNVDGGM